MSDFSKLVNQIKSGAIDSAKKIVEKNLGSVLKGDPKKNEIIDAVVALLISVINSMPFFNGSGWRSRKLWVTIVATVGVGVTAYLSGLSWQGAIWAAIISLIPVTFVVKQSNVDVAKINAEAAVVIAESEDNED